jgi:mevalonate kinase
VTKLSTKALNTDSEKIIPTTGISPGKLILSGEHSVVKGAPAVAFAIDRFVATHIIPAEEMPFKQLDFIKTSLDLRYHAFLKKSIKINEVIEKPEALIAYCVAQMKSHFEASFGEKNAGETPKGFALSTQTNLPVGCGMGSSAALILSLYKAIEGAFGFLLPASGLRELAIEAENLIHGKSSGLDIAICQAGGMHRFQQGKLTEIPCSQFSADLIHTGKPESSTGECVVQASLYLTPEKVEAFAKTTQKVEHAITHEDPALLWNAIRENHRLLCEIGVVPKRVQQLIQEIENAGGAAKICGAGSVTGDNAGVVWVYGNNTELYKKICESYETSWMGNVLICPKGAESCAA